VEIARRGLQSKILLINRCIRGWGPGDRPPDGLPGGRKTLNFPQPLGSEDRADKNRHPRVGTRTAR
ncbi:hypothetical protein, partial [Stutzerimonas stutzeri]|uniref:hypothetical protein n=1 Tax=Stutzerimonas stutzeri TaxID=316 RepID=UPI001C8BBA42